MQVVSFETAKRLKKAGFPWVQKIPFEHFCYSISGFLFRYKGSQKDKKIYLAPSATDILKQLPSHSLRFNGDVFSCVEWDLHSGGYFEYELHSFKYENPAEACAAAWLAKNEKP